MVSRLGVTWRNREARPSSALMLRRRRRARLPVGVRQPWRSIHVLDGGASSCCQASLTGPQRSLCQKNAQRALCLNNAQRALCTTQGHQVCRPWPGEQPLRVVHGGPHQGRTMAQSSWGNRLLRQVRRAGAVLSGVLTSSLCFLVEQLVSVSLTPPFHAKREPFDRNGASVSPTMARQLLVPSG